VKPSKKSHGSLVKKLAHQGSYYHLVLVIELLRGLLRVRLIKAALTSFVNEQKDDWDKLLLYTQFAYKTSVNAITKCTPFKFSKFELK
jgi:hypothetical protein